MAKGTYVGISGAQRKVKKIFVGIAGVARKVKSAYICVAGVIRKVFSTDITYLGEGVISLSTSTYTSSASSCVGAWTPNYALMVRSYEYTIDAFNASLVRTVIAIPSEGYFHLRSYTSQIFLPVGTYALLVAGYSSWGYGNSQVSAISNSLVLSSVTPIINSKSIIPSFVLNGLAVLAGGWEYDGNYYRNVDTYNASLVKGTLTDLTFTTNPNDVMSCSVGDVLGVIMTGNMTYKYNASFVRTDLPYNTGGFSFRDLTLQAATSKHIIVAGGRYGPVLKTAFAIDVNGVVINGLADLPQTVYAGGACKAIEFNDEVVIQSGVDGTNPQWCVSYDASLVQKELSPITTKRYYYGSSKVGNYLMFGGAYQLRDIVSLYTV